MIIEWILHLLVVAHIVCSNYRFTYSSIVNRSTLHHSQRLRPTEYVQLYCMIMLWHVTYKSLSCIGSFIGNQRNANNSHRHVETTQQCWGSCQGRNWRRVHCKHKLGIRVRIIIASHARHGHMRQVTTCLRQSS